MILEWYCAIRKHKETYDTEVAVAFTRASGLLLHPTSLPGRFGIGDLGKEAYNFVDFLLASGQSLWQVLPLGPTGYGDSPYQCFSALAGNPLLISLERLLDEGLLYNIDFKGVPHFSADRVNFGLVIKVKNTLLRKAFDNFKKSRNNNLRNEFAAFCEQSASWLDDYALFSALKESHSGASWSEWEPELVKRNQDALAAKREELKDPIEAKKFFQFLFFRQWSQLKAYCNEKGIKIIGDIPIFVAYDSVDLWAHPELFKLDKSGKMTVVAGVPPDFFSETGQLWGNPLYNWKRMRMGGYLWWIERLQAMLKLFDIIRLDHFRGFAACWEVPAGDKTAERGRWVHGPGKGFFTTLKGVFGELPIIAEDLGVITPDVEALRDDFKLPGMRVMQFAFNADSKNLHLPHNYIRNMVVYTGTHDNDTTVGWYENIDTETPQGKWEKTYCLKYLKSDGEEIHWDFIRAAFASVADTTIIPMQDLLGLDTNGRMNIPASDQGNWNWRLKPKSLTKELAERLRELTEIYGRARAEEKPVTEEIEESEESEESEAGVGAIEQEQLG
jgi:4-alpha-glucanotransferase